MNKLEYAAKRIKEYKAGVGAVNEYDVIRTIIEAVKEELTPKDQTFQEFFGLDEKPPQLIQGYTAENWQEIIDGGYLCEFRDKPGRWVCGLLASCSSDGENYYFIQDGIGGKKFCRPAQIKGVMRPIFVEPVDKSSMLCLFDCEGFPLNDRLSRPSWDGYKDGSGDFYAEATKYIEL